MATQITSLQELNRFYLRTSLCGKPEWCIKCGPEAVKTLAWRFEKERIVVDEAYTDGRAQVVSTCNQHCDGCNMEVVDLSQLIRALNFIPANQRLA